MARRLAVTLACGLALATAGCVGPGVVEVPVSAGSARVAQGEVLRVAMGEVNESVGDSWYLVERPDPAVLAEDGVDHDSDCDQPGCGGRLAWSFRATGRGSTEVVFRYCYRSRPPDCAPGPDRGPADPVTLRVTVT